jgi:hypothetical protein
MALLDQLLAGPLGDYAALILGGVIVFVIIALLRTAGRRASSGAGLVAFGAVIILVGLLAYWVGVGGFYWMAIIVLGLVVLFAGLLGSSGR